MEQPSSDGDVEFATLMIWSDSDWAGDSTRQSQSSLRIEVDGCPLFSTPRRQGAISDSSGEAEYYAGGRAASEGMYVKQFLEHAGFEAKMILLMVS